jgi:hypothetical protein
MRARGLRPCVLPAASLPTSTAAAPSTMPDELPAWCTCADALDLRIALQRHLVEAHGAELLEGGLERARPSSVVCGLMNSSSPRIVWPRKSFTGTTEPAK